MWCNFAPGRGGRKAENTATSKLLKLLHLGGMLSEMGGVGGVERLCL